MGLRALRNARQVLKAAFMLTPCRLCCRHINHMNILESRVYCLDCARW